MDKDLLKKLAEKRADDKEIEAFDDWMGEALDGPSQSFTDKVMFRVVHGKSRSINWHALGIAAGVFMVLVLWAFHGFITPEIALSYDFLNSEYLNVSTIDLTNITRVFMMANALLLLLLIDRVVQRHKRTT